MLIITSINTFKLKLSKNIQLNKYEMSIEILVGFNNYFN